MLIGFVTMKGEPWKLEENFQRLEAKAREAAGRREGPGAPHEPVRARLTALAGPPLAVIACPPLPPARWEENLGAMAWHWSRVPTRPHAFVYYHRRYDPT